MGKTNKPLDVVKFVRAKQAHMSDVDAYAAAGGTSEHPNQAAYAFKRKKSVQQALKEAMTEDATDAMLSVVALSSKAIAHLNDILSSDDPKNRKIKDKVAMEIIQRTRDVLPKEIKTIHEVSIDEESQDALEALAELLLSDKGAGGSLIEAIDVGAATSSPEDDGGESLTTEYTVCASQETSSSS